MTKGGAREEKKAKRERKEKINWSVDHLQTALLCLFMPCAHSSVIASVSDLIYVFIYEAPIHTYNIIQLLCFCTSYSITQIIGESIIALLRMIQCKGYGEKRKAESSYI